MVATKNVPDLPTKRLPVFLSSAITGKPRGEKNHGECPLSPRQIAKIVFQHLPESVDTSRPGILSSATDSADKVHLHYHDKNDGGARLVGNRVRTKEGSVTRDYVFILYREVWYLEPVSDTITGIRPLMQKGDVGPPVVDMAKEKDGRDLDVWEDGKSEVASASAPIGIESSFRSIPVSPNIDKSDGQVARKCPANSLPKLGTRKTVIKTESGSMARMIHAGKSIPGVKRGDEEEMEVSDDDSVYDVPTEATVFNGRIADKSVGHKSVGQKGLALSGQGLKEIPGGRKDEEISGGSGSESDADSSSVGSGSAGSSSGDSDDYTDRSSDDGGA